jgi:hypothetical protein
MPDDIAAHMQARGKPRMAITRTGAKVPIRESGGDGQAMAKRPMRAVPADEAGEWYGICEDSDLITMACNAGLITKRHRDALHEMHRYYHAAKPPGRAASGFSPGRGHGEMSDKQAAAWKAYARHLDYAPPETRHAVAVASCGEWPVFANALPLLRAGATKIADRMKISVDKPPVEMADGE